ncbi:MAG: hypothetical protein ACI97A_001059 [Planctomycetota bacterium]
MSTLQERLDRIRDAFEKEAPAEAIAVAHRATNDLRNSGIMTGIPKVGDKLLPFEMEDTDGTLVTSRGLLERGPLVISFYRGGW